MKPLIRYARQGCIAMVMVAAAMAKMALAAEPVAPSPVQTQVHTLDGHRVTLDVYPSGSRK